MNIITPPGALHHVQTLERKIRLKQFFLVKNILCLSCKLKMICNNLGACDLVGAFFVSLQCVSIKLKYIKDIRILAHHSMEQPIMSATMLLSIVYPVLWLHISVS